MTLPMILAKSTPMLAAKVDGLCKLKVKIVDLCKLRRQKHNLAW